MRCRQALFLPLIIMLCLVSPSFATTTCETDQQLANDEPGQKDLTKFCVSTGDDTFELLTEWNWDQVSGFNGENTGDACSLYDTDGDHNANLAVCVTIVDSDSGVVQTAGSPRLFTCNDSSPARCFGATAVALGNTHCEVTTAADDPFNADDEFPQDVKAVCHVDLDDFGNSSAVLIDACSYPSQEVNSDASDCIINAGLCHSDGNCAEPTPVCNETTGICTECDDSTDCSGETPVCDTSTGQCVECTPFDNQCSGETPVCNTSSNECVECNQSSDCPSENPVCDTSTNQCVQCTPTSDTCTGDTPVCDVSTGNCVPCSSDSQCPVDSPVCNTETGSCVDCTPEENLCVAPNPICIADSGTCAECQQSSDCSGTEPICDPSTNQCVGCLQASDCGGSTPVCDLTTHTCQPCTSDEQCFAAAPACSPTGSCVECTPTSNTCSGDEPVCDPTDNQCVECLENGDCTDGSRPFCDTSKNTCSECLSSADCSGDTPICSQDTGTCVACSSPEDCPCPAGSTADATCGQTGCAIGCRGESGACTNEKTIAPADTVCRTSGGICDKPESCSGTSTSCPANAFKESTVICRPVATLCDEAEKCTGTAAACPTDQQIGNCTAVCRTAGFWGTHGGGRTNITQTVIDDAGSCLQICGEVIKNTFAPTSTATNADSALEALCVPIEGVQALQLARQLTATSLNCDMASGDPRCTGTNVQTIFSLCNTACAAGQTSTIIDQSNVNCIAALDCINSGGMYDVASGFCYTGTCSDDPTKICTATNLTRCGTGATCVLNSDCDTNPLRNARLNFEPLQEAGSAKACTSANSSVCTVLQPKEGTAANTNVKNGCTAGTRSLLPELCL